MFSPEQIIGNIGEQWVYDQLTKRGYDVRMVPNYQDNIDLKIGQLPIEVKYSRIGFNRKIDRKTGEIRRYQRWQWNVSQVHGKGDLCLFLIAEDRAGLRWPFIMPGSVMAERDNFQISRHPSKYNGLIAGYLNAWETIDFLLKQQYYDNGQLAMYHLLTDEAGVYNK